MSAVGGVYSVKLYYTEEWGANARQVVLQSEKETFHSLLLRLAEARSILASPREAELNYGFVLRFVSTIRKPRAAIVPHAQERILSTLALWEEKWPGHVVLSLVYLSVGGMMRLSSSINKDGRAYSNLSTESGGGGAVVERAPSSSSSSSSNSSNSSFVPSCTEWIPASRSNMQYLVGHSSGGNGNQNDSSSQGTRSLPVHLRLGSNAIQQKIPDSIYDELSSKAIKQGRLHKNMSCFGLAGTSPPPVWLEEVFLLEEERLWFFNPKQAAEGPSCIHLSYIELEGGGVTTEYVDTSPSCTTFLIHYNNDSRGPMMLKAKTRDECEAWMEAINDRYKDRFENDEFIRAENTMTCEALRVSIDDVKRLTDLARFEGMLGNELLRKAFREFLHKAFVPESMKFWEYAEDFRRGHPSSHEGYDFYEKGVLNPMVHAWGQLIFNHFIKDGALFQVSDCSGVESEHLQHLLNSSSIPSPDVFARVQAVSYRKLKYDEGHYVAFVEKHDKGKNRLVCIFVCAISPSPLPSRRRRGSTKFTPTLTKFAHVHIQIHSPSQACASSAACRQQGKGRSKAHGYAVGV